MLRVLRAAVLACAACMPLSGFAQDPALVVHLLDYIAVDYAEAVAAGKVKNADEYKEMTEFAATVQAAIPKLPDHARKASLAEGAAALSRLVADKAPEASVAAAANALRVSLVEAYRISVGPREAPQLGPARALYATHCASCHGATGAGDGPFAKGLDPAPSNFQERERARQRSIHGLYNTLTLGVAGTAMRAFPELSEADRWALAFVAAGWGFSDEERARGKGLWASGQFREQFRSQADIAGRSAVEVQAALGQDAVAVLAWLRQEPGQLVPARDSALGFARAKIAESATLHRAGKTEAAVQAALVGYLEGFELAEASLSAVDAKLMREIEARMMAFREAVKTGKPAAEVDALAAAIDTDLARAQAALGKEGLSPSATFAASFVILFREGLEALLVVTALLAFLRRSGNTQAIASLHAGWIGALVLGIGTWFLASYALTISGAQREVAEGVASLVAAAMLLYVGLWLHGKSNAAHWQHLIRAEAERALGSRARWAMAGVSFLAVYREAFETVLFYQALHAQAGPDARFALLAGFVAGAGALLVAAWAMLRLGARLPLGIFFGATAVLLLVLSVVLTGQGVAALQEAGYLDANLIGQFSLPWLGIFPTTQGLFAQAGVAVLALAVYWRMRAPAGAMKGAKP